MFLAFILSFFAIFGFNLFSGFNYRACRTTPEPYELDDGTTVWPIGYNEFLCNSDEDCRKFMPDNPDAVCGNIFEKAGLDPKEYDNVIDNETIDFGVPGFDNFGQAMLTTF